MYNYTCDYGIHTLLSQSVCMYICIRVVRWVWLFVSVHVCVGEEVISSLRMGVVSTIRRYCGTIVYVCNQQK